MSLDKISDNVKALADKVATEITFDGNVASVPKDLYKKTLPEGMDIETVKKVQEHNMDFSDAVTLAFGRRATEHLRDNKDIDSASLSVNVAHDRVSSEFRRHKTYRNPSDNSTFDRHGVTETKFVSGINAKRNGYKEIQAYLSAEAESIFKQ